nr:glycosyltransferase family 4 protein [uncultured Desulfobacter sp.]
MNNYYKIIHTSSRTLWGNREKRILCESLWMKKHGHQVVIVAPGDSPLFKKAKKDGLMVYPMSFKALAGIGEYGRLKEIFTGEQPFVVNAHGKCDAKLALKAAQATDVPCRIMSRHNGKRVKYTWSNKKTYKTRPHYIFTTSKESKTHLRQTFSLSDMQIFSFPDGIIMPDSDIYIDRSKRAAGRQALSNTLGVAPDSRFIGVFGTTDTQNKQLLRTLAAQLDRHFPFHHIVILGTPDTQETLDEKLSARVHILQLTEENEACYQALDCCIYLPDHQNFYQGVPLEVTMAMACFCPVIGPDAPGIREILIDNKTGKVFNPKQPESLPTIISWVLNTPPDLLTLIRTARTSVEKHHTMDAIGRDILRIYRLRQIKLDRRFQMIS